jgi:hypothetical protein
MARLYVLANLAAGTVLGVGMVRCLIAAVAQ